MSEQTTSKKNTHREIKIIIEVNDAAEQFYPESVKLGMHARKSHYKEASFTTHWPRKCCR